MTDLYHEVIIDLARHPAHVGQIADADAVLHAHNASCGDDITLYLKIDQSTQKIIDIKWQGHGCIISQAAMSVLSEKIIDQGLTISQVQSLSQTDLENWLGIENISIGRVKCLMLGVSGFKEIKANS